MKTDKKFRSIVAEATDHAKLVAWDTCHKIYIAMDDAEARWYIDNEWQCFIGSPEAMLDQVCEWYESSCGLQFVDATSTGKTSTESEHFSEFNRVIPQGAEARWDWTVEEEYWDRKESA
jgi:hypothetical protein